MAHRQLSTGKKRALEEADEDRASTSSLSSAPSERPMPKRSKRVETRRCPVCEELIPIRLLPTHVQVENLRVENIIKNIGSSQSMEEFDDTRDGSRRSAARARKTFRANIYDSVEQSCKTIQTIIRRRKRRNAMLQQPVGDDGDYFDTAHAFPDSVVCPVCMQTIRGDEDFTEVHVNACLERESERLEQERMMQEQTNNRSWNARDGVHVGNVSGVRGAGFHLRDPNAQDVEDEIDIDGDDEAVFGGAQFTESDILLAPSLAAPSHGLDVLEDADVQIDDDHLRNPEPNQAALHNLEAGGQDTVLITEESYTPVSAFERDAVAAVDIGSEPEEVGLAPTSAHRNGDLMLLVEALKQKIRHLESLPAFPTTSMVCRICLEPYTEPTVSTGCWHTCCRECWLRCLGSTKLCPICKRITIATDLRRVYL